MILVKISVWIIPVAELLRGLIQILVKPGDNRFIFYLDGKKHAGKGG